MKKELLLRKHVIQEVCLSALEIEPQVKDEVYVIEEKSKYAASAVQFIYNEMNRLVDYSKSRYGETYIQRHFPKFEDDKALALDIADFYWVILEWESKGQSDIDETEEDELIGGITEELDDFFRNFFLERHLKELAESIKVDDPFLRLFKDNEDLMNRFVRECREQSLTAKDIVHKYKMLGDRVIQKQKERGVIKTLYEGLHKLGIVTIQYPTFQDYF